MNLQQSSGDKEHKFSFEPGEWRALTLIVPHEKRQNTSGYAVTSSLLLSFLESVPEVDAKIKDPNTADEAFENVVQSAQDAAVLVLVY